MDKNEFKNKLQKFLENNNCLEVTFPKITDDTILVASFVSVKTKDEIETAKNSENFNGWVMANFRETKDVPAVASPNRYYRMDFKKN